MTTNVYIYTGTDEVGRGYLVTIRDDGTAEVATRFPDLPSIAWDPPIALEAVTA